MASSIDLSTYQLELLHISDEFGLYRGRQPEKAESILLLKVLGVQSETTRFLRLQRELALAEDLDSAWAAKPIALGRHEGQSTLILEDCGGTPLDRLLDRPFEIRRFLEVAISLTVAVGQMHARGLVHKDIKPGNILVDTGGRVWLTGFGIAIKLARERQAPVPVQTIQGTLAYMAPEQTGRVNRFVDARTDLYTLGVTLYQMSTGTLPFLAFSPSEWIHCHVARKPTPLRDHRKGLPEQLEMIIMKLLSKTAEERYQTARGLSADFQRCLESLERRACILPFDLAMNDKPDYLQVPERLYGRAHESSIILAAADRVVSGASSEIVLVAGPAGVGKTSIIGDLHKGLLGRSLLFVAGKSDQYALGVPYPALAHAFRGLIGHLLSTNDDELGDWRRKLLDALGPNGELMINLVPELSLIIGEQAPAPDVPPQEVQKRFYLVFRRFLCVFAQRTHPLTLFIDDLQWLDMATIELVTRVAADPEIRHLLLICAFRDNEIQEASPLAGALDLIRNGAKRCTEVQLGALSCSELNQLLSDALRSNIDEVNSLTQSIHQKTGGNPFFAVQFLISLSEEGIIDFDSKKNAWIWDLERIDSKSITENVADLLVIKTTKFPLAVVEAIKYLACLGNSIQLATLSSILGWSIPKTEAALVAAVHAGFVLCSDGKYGFSHDRMQEAAYSLISEADRPMLHLRIGRTLLSIIPPIDIDENIFEIVDHFGQGARLVQSVEERFRIAELNLRAGRRARTATAYASALKYLKTGHMLLPHGGDDQQYRLDFEITLLQAECEFLTGDRVIAEKRLTTLSAHARGTVDSAAVVRLRIALYTLGSPDRAVEVGLGFLRNFGIRWDAHPTELAVRTERSALMELLGSRPIEELVQLPRMKDANFLSTMEVMASLILPSLMTDNNLEDIVLMHMAYLSLIYGNCDASCYAYSQINVALGLRFGDYQAGRRFGELGCDLVDKHGMDRFKARVYSCFSTFSAPWTKHLRECLPMTRRAVEVGNSVGDLVFVVATTRAIVENLLISGEPLANVQREAEQHLTLARTSGFEAAADGAINQLLLVRQLRGVGNDDGAPSIEIPDQVQFQLYLEQGREGRILPLAWYWIRQIQTCYLKKNFAGALEATIKAGAILSATRSLLDVAEYHFYGALVEAMACDRADVSERARHFEALQKHSRHISVWAQNCRENFGCRSALVAAEIARLNNQELSAQILYEEAVRTAREFGFVQNEALANELAAEFYEVRGLKTSADAYWRNATACYARWGAYEKVRQIQQICPHLRDIDSASSIITKSQNRQESLDLTAILKVSQTVSSEIVLERLVERLMITVIEHAGAERGLMLLPRVGKLRISAEIVSSGERIEVTHRNLEDVSGEVPDSIVNYVLRSHEVVILDDALATNPYSTDPYIDRAKPRSALCIPLLKQGELVGILYIENRLLPNVFTREKLSILQILASQAAISIENANVFAALRLPQESARRAQEMMQRAFDMIPAQAWRNAPDGTFEMANKQWYDYFGISQELAKRGDWMNSFHGDDGEKAITKWKEFLATGIGGTIESRIRRFDGKSRWFISRLSPFRNDDGVLVNWYGTSTDIDDLKHAEALILAEKQLLQMNTESYTLPEILEFLATSVDGLIEGSSTRIMLLDPTTGRLYELPRQKSPLRNFSSIGNAAIELLTGLVGNEGHKEQRIVVSDIATHPAWTNYRKMAQADGLKTCWSTPIFSSQSTLLGVQAVYFSEIRNITQREISVIEQFVYLASTILERKRSEDALTRSRALLSEGQSISHTGSWEWNTRANTISLSEECARLVGLPRKEATIPYSSFLACIHPEDRSRVATMHQTMDTAGYYESRHRILLPDGSIRSVQSRGRRLSGAQSDSTEHVGTIVDITEQKRLNQELQDSLDEKDSLLKEVHHRVKNNLQLISSMLNLQASRIGDKVVSELFSESRNRVRSMALVHENLYRAGNFSKVSMEDHIKTLSASIVRAYGINGAEVVLVTDIEDILLGIDRAISVGLIVNELVSNALKHAFPDGRSGQVRIELARSGENRCILAVVDDGAGLPQKIDPNRAESMGLQLVHDLSQQINGTISVKRAGGTSFTVTFFTEEQMEPTQ